MLDADVKETKLFTIRVRKGDWEVEVSAPDESFVLKESCRIIEKFELKDTVVHQSEGLANQLEEAKPRQEVDLPRTAKPQTLNEFFRQFKLQTNLEKIMVLGYWCEMKMGLSCFTVEDILAKYKEVRESPPANIRRDLVSLHGKGMLLLAEGTAYALTNTGIRDVESKIL